MSLQERTLVVKNFDPDQTTSSILKELFIQGGPVRNIVIKPDHAFVEFEDIDSVGYSKALLDGIELFGKRLILEPKTRSQIYYKFTHLLQEYIRFDKQQRQKAQQQQHMMLYNQQQALQPPHQPIGLSPIDPSPQLQLPIDYVAPAMIDHQIFEYTQFTQNQFTSPNHMPSSSIHNRNHNNDNIRRSRSFNHRNESNGNWQNRGHGWPRQR